MSLAAVLLGAILAVAASPCAFAQGGGVDPVFGGASLGLEGKVQTIVQQPDGKLIVFGGLNGVNRLNVDGTTDTSFRADFNYPLDIYAGVVLANGKILFTASDPQLARLNPDGTADSTFSADTFTAEFSYPRGLALQRDGKVLVSGVTVSGETVTSALIARFNVDDTVDAGFHSAAFTNGTTAGGVDSMLVQPDGRIIVCGGFTQIDGVARNSLARLNADGTLDTTYDPLADGEVYSVAPQTDGKLVVAGGFDQIGGGMLSSRYLARLNSDGTLDASFSYGYFISPAEAVISPGGQILLWLSDESLIRLNPDGSIDAGFNTAVFDGQIYQLPIIPQTDGTLLVGGPFSQIDGIACNSVARLQANGSVDTGYQVDIASGPNANVTSLALQGDGKIMVGGNFTQVGGNAHHGVARLKSDGTVDATFSASADSDGSYTAAVAGTTLQPDGKILVFGSFSKIDGAACNGLARLNTDGSIDTSFNGSLFLDCYDCVPQRDGKLLYVGQLSDANDSQQYGIARLNTDGSQDSGFQTGIFDYGGSAVVAIQSDGKILVAGSFSQINGVACPGLIRLNTDGSMDSGFDASAAEFLESAGVRIAVQPDNKILFGAIFYVNGQSYGLYLIRLNPDGSRDATFNATPNSEVFAIAAQEDGTIVIGGNFTQVGDVAVQAVAYLNADGSLNPFLNSGTGANGAVNVLAPQADGKILVGGSFSSINGVLRNYVARLKSGGTPDFFNAGVPVGGGFYYLKFDGGAPFGYYNLSGDGYSFPYFFHDDLGMEYFFDAQDGAGGAYFYDFASNTFFYTSPGFPWPYLYDFSLDTVLYYYPDPTRPDHYNTNGVRYFYNYRTGQIISK